MQGFYLFNVTGEKNGMPFLTLPQAKPDAFSDLLSELMQQQNVAKGFLQYRIQPTLQPYPVKDMTALDKAQSALFARDLNQEVAVFADAKWFPVPIAETPENTPPPASWIIQPEERVTVESLGDLFTQAKDSAVLLKPSGSIAPELARSRMPDVSLVVKPVEEDAMEAAVFQAIFETVEQSSEPPPFFLVVKPGDGDTNEHSSIQAALMAAFSQLPAIPTPIQSVESAGKAEVPPDQLSVSVRPGVMESVVETESPLRANGFLIPGKEEMFLTLLNPAREETSMEQSVSPKVFPASSDRMMAGNPDGAEVLSVEAKQLLPLPQNSIPVVIRLPVSGGFPKAPIEKPVETNGMKPVVAQQASESEMPVKVVSLSELQSQLPAGEKPLPVMLSLDPQTGAVLLMVRPESVEGVFKPEAVFVLRETLPESFASGVMEMPSREVQSPVIPASQLPVDLPEPVVMKFQPASARALESAWMQPDSQQEPVIPVVPSGGAVQPQLSPLPVLFNELSVDVEMVSIRQSQQPVEIQVVRAPELLQGKPSEGVIVAEKPVVADLTSIRTILESLVVESPEVSVEKAVMPEVRQSPQSPVLIRESEQSVVKPLAPAMESQQQVVAPKSVQVAEPEVIAEPVKPQSSLVLPEVITRQDSQGAAVMPEKVVLEMVSEPLRQYHSEVIQLEKPVQVFRMNLSSPEKVTLPEPLSAMQSQAEVPPPVLKVQPQPVGKDSSWVQAEGVVRESNATRPSTFLSGIMQLEAENIPLSQNATPVEGEPKVLPEVLREPVMVPSQGESSRTITPQVQQMSVSEFQEKVLVQAKASAAEMSGKAEPEGMVYRPLPSQRSPESLLIPSDSVSEPERSEGLSLSKTASGESKVPSLSGRPGRELEAVRLKPMQSPVVTAGDLRPRMESRSKSVGTERAEARRLHRLERSGRGETRSSVRNASREEAPSVSRSDSTEAVRRSEGRSLERREPIEEPRPVKSEARLNDSASSLRPQEAARMNVAMPSVSSSSSVQPPADKGVNIAQAAGAAQERPALILNDQPVLEQIVQQAKANLSGGRGEVQLRLEPDYLGKLRMQISVEDGRVTARIVTETHEARSLLERNLSELKLALGEQGLKVQEVKLTLAGGGEDYSSGSQSFQRERHASMADYGASGRRESSFSQSQQRSSDHQQRQPAPLWERYAWGGGVHVDYQA